QGQRPRHPGGGGARAHDAAGGAGDGSGGRPVKVRFWGVRGSFATPGPHFLRYGGNTPAVEITTNAGRRVLIDLGTGVTELAKQLMQGEFGEGRGTLPVLLTHTHLDHIQGLPFFTPFFIKGNKIQIHGAALTGLPLAAVLQNQLNGHYSPLYGLENLAYLSDVEYPVEGPTPEALALARGADLLIHDAMFSDAEYESRAGWGHSPV